ncbi:MAG: hypothetical protein BV456_11455, partial [Thermoplasmata archaeon M8B2D]
CGNRSALNSHHVISRANKSVRWDLHNGVCLCVGHHIGMQSAHKNPLWFIEWIKKERGEDWYHLLRIKSNQVSKLHKFEKELLLKELRKELNMIKVI